MTSDLVLEIARRSDAQTDCEQQPRPMRRDTADFVKCSSDWQRLRSDHSPSETYSCLASVSSGPRARRASHMPSETASRDRRRSGSRGLLGIACGCAHGSILAGDLKAAPPANESAQPARGLSRLSRHHSDAVSRSVQVRRWLVVGSARAVDQRNGTRKCLGGHRALAGLALLPA